MAAAGATEVSRGEDGTRSPSVHDSGSPPASTRRFHAGGPFGVSLVDRRRFVGVLAHVGHRYRIVERARSTILNSRTPSCRASIGESYGRSATFRRDANRLPTGREPTVSLRAPATADADVARPECRRARDHPSHESGRRFDDAEHSFQLTVAGATTEFDDGRNPTAGAKVPLRRRPGLQRGTSGHASPEPPPLGE